MNAAITIYEDHPMFAEVAAALAEGETTAKATSKKKASKKKASANKTTGDLAEVKKAMAAAKKEHGEDFVLQVLEEVGETSKPEETIGRQLSACPPENHKAMIEAFEAGPDEEEGEVDADAVRMAIKAYAKEEGKTAAKKKLKKFDHSLSDLEELDNEDEETLAELMKAFT